MNFDNIVDRAVAADPDLVRVLGEVSARNFIIKNGIRPENMPDFAQAIFAQTVRECATALDAYLNVCNSNRMIGWQGKDILKHFGVEE
jgi:hypothetical protein